MLEIAAEALDNEGLAYIDQSEPFVVRAMGGKALTLTMVDGVMIKRGLRRSLGRLVELSSRMEEPISSTQDVTPSTTAVFRVTRGTVLYRSDAVAEQPTYETSLTIGDILFYYPQTQHDFISPLIESGITPWRAVQAVYYPVNRDDC